MTKAAEKYYFPCTIQLSVSIHSATSVDSFRHRYIVVHIEMMYHALCMMNDTVLARLDERSDISQVIIIANPSPSIHPCVQSSKLTIQAPASEPCTISWTANKWARWPSMFIAYMKAYRQDHARANSRPTTYGPGCAAGKLVMWPTRPPALERGSVFIVRYWICRSREILLILSSRPSLPSMTFRWVYRCL